MIKIRTSIIKTGIVLALVVGFSSIGKAQDMPLEGKIVIIADPQLNNAINRRVDLFLADSTTQGYRVQIMAKNDRKEALLEFENFQLKYPEVPIYLKYDSPNFKLRVGDFPSKVEAHYWFAKLQAEFPLLFIVPDKINPKQIIE